MSNSATLSGSTRNPVVRLTRRFDAPVEDVWSAWTDPQRAARWLARLPGPLVEGGAVVVHMGVQGDEYPTTWRVRRLEPPHLLQFVWDDANDHDGVITVTLEASGDGTQLTLQHELAPADGAGEIAIDFGRGWEGFLGALDVHLSGGDAAAIRAANEGGWESRRSHWAAQAGSLATDADASGVSA